MWTLSSTLRPATKDWRSALTDSRLEAGDEAQKVVGVGADVADGTAGAGALGVGAPGGLLVARVGGERQPVLRVLGLDDADLAERAGLHEVAGLPDQRVAGVVVGEEEPCAVLGLHRSELAGSRKRVGQRLVADDVDAGLEEGLRRTGVHVVGGDDRDGLDAVGPGGLLRRHLLVARVDAVGSEPEVLARLLRRGGVRAQRAGDEVVVAIEARGDAVDVADEGARAAADHAQADFARSVLCHFASPSSPRILRFADLSVPGGGKVVEGALGDADDVALDQRRALGRPLLGMLQRAFPFEHGPAVEVVARELGEDAGEIDLAVAGRAEAPGPVHPALVAGIDALLAGRIELGVLDVEHPDPLVVEIDVLQVVELLQHEVARIVEQVRARVVVHALEEHLVGDAVVEILARMDLVADVDTVLVEGVEDRQPAPCQLVEGLFDEAGGALRERIDVGPGKRAREGRRAP